MVRIEAGDPFLHHRDYFFLRQIGQLALGLIANVAPVRF